MPCVLSLASGVSCLDSRLTFALQFSSFYREHATKKRSVMKATFFMVRIVIAAVLMTGCASVVTDEHTAVVEPVAPEPNTAADDEATAERFVWFLLDHSSNLFVVYACSVDTEAEDIGIADDSDWRIANRAWGLAVNGWLYGVERLRRTVGSRERLGALLALEDDLLELESSLHNLETAAAGVAPEAEGLRLVLGFLGVAIRQARDAVEAAHSEFIRMPD